MDIDSLRKDVDSVDSELTRLLQKRMETVRKIGEIKKENNISVEDSEREAEIFRKISSECFPSFEEDVCAVFSQLVSLSRQRQEFLLSHRFGLLGETLEHSISPQIHKLLGKYSYRCYPVKKENLAAFISSCGLHGFNVTIPYKRDVMKMCGVLSETAEKTGAVNTVLRLPDGRLSGFNTDSAGFAAALLKNGISPENKKVLILGSGGAGKTARYTVEKLGCREAVTVSRSGSENYGNISRHKDADIIINATPVGMYPENGESPVDLSVFENPGFVFDMIYNPQKTALLFSAEKLGIKCDNGLFMLCAQAVKSAEIFLGKNFENHTADMIFKKIKFDFNNIILIGMPGSGKTSAGKILAEKCGKIFIDTDEEIEKKYGKNIPEIFRENGEDFFRNSEISTIKNCGALNGCVIATGGGCVTRAENLEPLKQNGTVVYIDRPAEELSTDGRPLSVKAGGTQKLFEKRRALYESFADVTVKAGQSPDETAARIYEIIGKGE